jgi:hypothetical protein
MYFYQCTTHSTKKSAVKSSEVAKTTPVAETVVAETVTVVPDADAVKGDTVETVVGLAVVEEVKVDINRMNKSALFKLAAEKGLEVDPAMTRNELVKLLS